MNDKTKTIWYDKTLKMIVNTAIPISKIEQDTALNRRWLYRFMNGELPNASVNMVNTLHEYLKHRK